MTTRSELRAMARQSLTGQWGRNAFFMLVIYLAVFFIGFVPIVGDIALFVCSGAGTLGIIGYFLDTSRGQRPSFASFFDGFNDFVRAFVLYLLTTIFTLLWTLCSSFPALSRVFATPKPISFCATIPRSAPWKPFAAARS